MVREICVQVMEKVRELFFQILIVTLAVVFQMDTPYQFWLNLLPPSSSSCIYFHHNMYDKCSICIKMLYAIIFEYGHWINLVNRRCRNLPRALIRKSTGHSSMQNPCKVRQNKHIKAKSLFWKDTSTKVEQQCRAIFLIVIALKFVLIFLSDVLSVPNQFYDPATASLIGLCCLSILYNITRPIPTFCPNWIN